MNPNAIWKVQTPEGETLTVKDLKGWCAERDLSYFTVWGCKDGWDVQKLADDAATARAEGYVHMTDADTGEVLLSKHNGIHFENLSEALVLSLANRPQGHVHMMAFGNGASTVSGTGAATYFPPNTTGQSAQLYNETYWKVVDDMSPMNEDPSSNYVRVQHAMNTTFTDLVVTCVLERSEPDGQNFTDTEYDTEVPYVFDEFGLKSYDPNGQGKLLTHVIFHPILKSSNRRFRIVYTVRIFMA